MAELIFIALISLFWEVVKGLLLILVTYYVYGFLIEMIEMVWNMIHPKSLKWMKSKFNKKKSA
jgi:hypothetical protein